MGDKIPNDYDKTRNIIKNWVVTEHCKFAPSKGPEWVWGFNVTKSDQGFSVFQVSGRPESLFISVNADLIEYQSLFEGLAPEEQRALVFEIRLALTNCDMEFEVADDLKAVGFRRQMFVEDNLTQTIFWDKVFNLHKAMLVVTFSVERRIPLS